MAINKIIKFGLEEEASKLKEQGISDQKIADELSSSSGQKITRSTVYRYFSNSNRDPVVRNVKQREEIVTKAVNGRLDAVNQINNLRDEALYVLNEAKASDDFRTMLKAMERVEKQVELIAKIGGDIQTAPTIIYAPVQVNQEDVTFEEVVNVNPAE